MTAKWPAVPLGQVLRLEIDAVPVDPSATYPIAGVYSFGRGLLARPALSGSATTYRVFRRLHEGALVLSQLKAWEGALAKVTKEYDGWFLSPQFATFRPVPGQLEIDYLAWFCSLPAVWERLRRTARGMGARRDSVSPGRFLSLEIPLPQLEEQRRIVAKLDAVSEKINEARARRAEADEGRHRVLIAMAHRGDLSTGAKASLGWRRVRLEEVVTQVTDERAVDTGATYPNLGIYSYARGLFAKPPIEGLATSAAKLNRVRTGQFIYSRLFAFEGAYAIVEPEFNGCFVSNEYPTFECDRSSATPEFLAAYFRAPAVWAQVAAGSKGLGDRRQRVQPGQLLSHELYLPPLAWQERIGGVMAELRSLGEVTRKTGEELDGLMPAILDRAFRGEL